MPLSSLRRRHRECAPHCSRGVFTKLEGCRFNFQSSTTVLRAARDSTRTLYVGDVPEYTQTAMVESDLPEPTLFT